MKIISSQVVARNIISKSESAHTSDFPFSYMSRTLSLYYFVSTPSPTSFASALRIKQLCKSAGYIGRKHFTLFYIRHLIPLFIHISSLSDSTKRWKEKNRVKKKIFYQNELNAWFRRSNVFVPCGGCGRYIRWIWYVFRSQVQCAKDGETSTLVASFHPPWVGVCT